MPHATKYPLIHRVYTGRPGCMCGCKGNYSENPSVVSRVVNTLIENAGAVETMVGLDGALIFSLTTETRSHVVYCATPTRRAA